MTAAGTDVLPRRRYEVLDSWRGICAVLTAFFHFNANGHLYDLTIVRNGPLYVDFFFVLSGFVIAYGYADRLRDGYGIARFMFLRAGRVWPLHVFVLAVYVLFELVFSGFIGEFAQTDRGAFSGAKSIDAMIAHIFLVQSLNLYEVGTWNGPSWSISVEFWTYLIYAVIAAAVALRAYRVALGVLALLLFAAFAGIDGLTMGAAHQWGLLRGLYGFAVGALLHQVVVHWGGLMDRLAGLSFGAATVLELAAVALAGLFIVHAPQTFVWNLTPLVFGLVILVFCEERGAVSALLRTPPALLLGTLSYSIYLTHSFIQARLTNFGAALEKFLGVDVFTRHPGDGAMLLGPSRWAGDAWFVLMLAIVVGVSWLTYRFVEDPGRTWSRRMARRIWQDHRRNGASTTPAE